MVFQSSGLEIPSYPGFWVFCRPKVLEGVFGPWDLGEWFLEIEYECGVRDVDKETSDRSS